MAKYTLCVQLDAKAKTELPKLGKKMGVGSVVDVVRKALAVIELIVDHQKAGGKVVLENRDGKQEVLRII
jgi:hypothetical protein